MTLGTSGVNEVTRNQAKYGISTEPVGREPLVFVEGKGLILRDIDGKEYLDCFGGYSAGSKQYD